MFWIVPILLVIGYTGSVLLEPTLIQGSVWAITLSFTIILARMIFRMVYPSDSKPVAEGQVEDAVLVYTWTEAIHLNQVYIYVWGALLLASLMVI